MRTSSIIPIKAALETHALQWGLLHQVDAPEDVEDPYPAAGEYLGGGRWMPLAGEGTPWVAEFAVCELAAALGLSDPAARRLVGDALELAHRLPLTWARIQAGQLPAWRGRRLAELTRNLSADAAGWFDRQVAPFAHRLSEGRVRDLIEAARLRFALTGDEGCEPSDGRGVDFVDVGGGQVFVY